MGLKGRSWCSLRSEWLSPAALPVAPQQCLFQVTLTQAALSSLPNCWRQLPPSSPVLRNPALPITALCIYNTILGPFWFIWGLAICLLAEDSLLRQDRGSAAQEPSDRFTPGKANSGAIGRILGSPHSCRIPTAQTHWKRPPPSEIMNSWSWFFLTLWNIC